MDVSSIVMLIGYLLRLGLLIVGEVFEEKRRARIANEKWEMTRARVAEIAEKCAMKLREEAAIDHAQAVDVEDRVDASHSKKP